jgi:hypothetical protein
MRKKLIAAAAIALVAAAVAGMATARGAATRQQIAFTYENGKASATKLTTLGSGPLQGDSGSTNWCCWTQKEVEQDGDVLDVNNPLATFAGKNGSLTWRERITWHDLVDNYFVATGTWRIVRGTGAYEHLSGQGHLVLIQRGGKTLTFRAVALVAPSS